MLNYMILPTFVLITLAIVITRTVSFFVDWMTYGSDKDIHRYMTTIQQVKAISHAVVMNDRATPGICSAYLTFVDASRELKDALKWKRFKKAHDCWSEITEEVDFVYKSIT